MTSTETRRTGVAQASAHARPVVPAQHTPGPTPARLTEHAPDRRYGRLARRSRPQGDPRGAPDSRDSTTKHTGLPELRRPFGFAVVAVGRSSWETTYRAAGFSSLASPNVSCQGSKIDWGARARETSPGSIRGRAEATYEPVLRQHHAKGPQSHIARVIVGTAAARRVERPLGWQRRRRRGGAPGMDASPGRAA